MKTLILSAIRGLTRSLVDILKSNPDKVVETIEVESKEAGVKLTPEIKSRLAGMLS